MVTLINIGMTIVATLFVFTLFLTRYAKTMDVGKPALFAISLAYVSYICKVWFSVPYSEFVCIIGIVVFVWKVRKNEVFMQELKETLYEVKSMM